MATASTADERLPDTELPRAPSLPSDGLEEEPEPATTFAFGPDPRRDNNNNNNKRSVPNVRLPIWDGKSCSEPGAYKKWIREIKAIQLAHDIQDNRYVPLLFLATKDDACDVLWDLDAESLTSLEMTMDRINKEFEKLDFEKSELAYQDFARCRRTPGQPMTAHFRDMGRTYTKMIKEDESTRLSEVTLARRLIRRSGLNLLNPKPEHTTPGQERSGKIGCQHNYLLRKLKSTFHPKASKTRRFNVSPEARTSEILCKPTEEQQSPVDPRFIRGLSAVYQRGKKRSLFLAADQWNDAFLSL